MSQVDLSPARARPWIESAIAANCVVMIQEWIGQDVCCLQS
jgi:hypothetical protein